MQKNIYNAFLATLMVFVMGFVLFLPLVPIVALFFQLIWNAIAEYLRYPHAITYLESIKLCLYLFILRGLLSIKINYTHNNEG